MTPELSLLIKVTVALAVGLTAAGLATRARASVRHLVLTATLGALIALPLAGALMPDLTVAIQVPTPREAIVFAPGAETGRAAAPSVFESATARINQQTGDRFRGVSLASAMRIVWAGGAVMLLGLLTRGLWKVRQVRRSGIPWLAGQAVVDRLSGNDGHSSPVSVVLHEHVPAPVTCGWRHPVIVLPADAQEWTDTDVERAIVHELEHVRRGDWIVQLAARVVCAAYWFHPLVWVAWRRLCLECERACDDAVVDTFGLRQGYGGPVADTDYAQQLVTLAGRLSQADAQPVLSMARRSDLSVRVRAVLDRTQLRGPAGISAVIATIIMAAAFSLMIAPMRVEAVPGEAREAAPEAAAAQNRRVGNVTSNRRGTRPGVLGRALVEAANEDDIDGVRELLDAGADVNAVVQGDGTALLIAAREGHREIVELLLQRGAVDVGVSGDGSALMMAAREGYGDIVRLLLDAGADVNLAVRGDGSALILAAREGYRNIARLLLDRGADVNLAVEGDGNPLIMAAREGNLEITRMLLDGGALVNEVVPGDENALIGASGAGYLEIVKLLVSRGADVNSRVWADVWDRGFTRGGEWRTPLSIARRERHADVVRYLQSVGATD